MTRRRRRTDRQPRPLPTPAVHEDRAPDPGDEDHGTAPLTAVVLDPQCCQVERQRRLEGTSILVLTTHQTGCPVWTAR
ncbi:hypothetical protein EDD99_0376 [Streptomyces sp. 846.5]|nr:hypothetical protein [Streptomyces sp. 846.5]TDU01992.1 hypothetical protein EDD99_0376 [Streptomyces sp. 846.5]